MLVYNIIKNKIDINLALHKLNTIHVDKTEQSMSAYNILQIKNDINLVLDK